MESFWLKVQPTFQLPSHQVNVKCPKLQLRSLGGKTLSVQALLCHVFCLQQVGVWLTAWKLQKYCVHHPRQWRLEHPTAACRKESRITTQGECDYPLSNPDCPPLDALRSQEGARTPEKPIVLPEVSNRTEELSTRQGWWFRKYSLPSFHVPTEAIQQIESLHIFMKRSCKVQSLSEIFLNMRRTK